LRRENSAPSTPISDEEETNDEENPTPSLIRTVILLPLGDTQIRVFAEAAGVHDAQSFLSEIQRQNASNFARRPLDLSELVTTLSARSRNRGYSLKSVV
jgi:hypothetical protein